MVYDHNRDSAECPDHGMMTGMLMQAMEGMDPIHALIEIRAAQAGMYVRRMADYFRSGGT